MQTQEQISIDDLYALDCETACNVLNCPGRGCKHALIPHKGRLTLWGIMAEGAPPTYFHRMDDFNAWLAARPHAATAADAAAQHQAARVVQSEMLLRLLSEAPVMGEKP